MNTYELNIKLINEAEKLDHIHYHIECDDSTLKYNLHKIASEGLLIEDGYNKKYIPGNRIDNIEVRILERIQTIPDVTESIKHALIEK